MEHRAFQLECKIQTTTHSSGQRQAAQRWWGGRWEARTGPCLSVKGRAGGTLGKQTGAPLLMAPSARW